MKKHAENWEEYSEKDEIMINVPNTEDMVDCYRRLLKQQPAYDDIVNFELQLQHEEKM